MAKKVDAKGVGSMIASSADEVSELVKAAAHSNRLQVMALLADGPKEFSYLLEKVGLSKTALANHIERVLGLGLVERVERGEYRLTEDGIELLGAIATFYEGSKARQVHANKRIQEQYSKSYDKPGNGERLVSREPVYQPCWLSYLGAVSGVLKSLGKDRDVVDVGGYTGYAFITNVSRGMTCPSAPTCHRGWVDIVPATSMLGFRISNYEDNKCFPQSKPLSAEDHERAMKVFQIVKRSIDNDRPVVLWGLDIPEYGIVKGYKGESYLVSTYRTLNKMPDGPIRYDALDAPGCINAIIFKDEVPDMTEKDDKNALKRAIRFAEGTGLAHKNYVAGPKAYDEWADVLERESKELPSYLGNSYVSECYEEGNGLAAAFLIRLAKRYSNGQQTEHLMKAAKEYESAHELMKKFTAIFPFAFEGDMSVGKRKKGAEILRQVKPHIVAAIGHMKKAVEVWK